jgi:hypothetical protein
MKSDITDFIPNSKKAVNKFSNIISGIYILSGLFLVISIFFSYGLGTNFFSKIFVFLSGVTTILVGFVNIKSKSTIEEKYIEFYYLWPFTLVWVFFAVGTDSAGVIDGQAYNFTGDVYVPILLCLFVNTIIGFFVHRTRK